MSSLNISKNIELAHGYQEPTVPDHPNGGLVWAGLRNPESGAEAKAD